jgi:hypothetical protein
MTTSYNGWPASTSPAAIDVGPFSVAGVEFVGGVRRGDVATVLHHVLLEFHERVEPLVDPGCWGWSYRPDRNDPNKLSCHSSATAADANAPKHPNGVEAAETFTDAQIKAVHAILSEIPELAKVVHWGGDWHRADGLTPDPMHWEIHDHDLAKLARVAERCRRAAVLKELIALRQKHGVTLVEIGRIAFRGALDNAGPIRRAKLRAALTAAPKR